MHVARAGDRRTIDAEFAEIAPADFSYRMAGDFSRAAGRSKLRIRRQALSAKLRIMKRQVTVAEYRALHR